MLTDVKEFVALTIVKREAKAVLREVQESLDRLEVTVLDWLLQQGVDKLTVDGMTVFPRNDIYLERKEGVDPVAVLVAAGMMDCVMAGSQRLKALAREARDGEVALPPAIAECYVVVERARLSARRATE